MQTNILYLIGSPGVGKYTIAQELTKHGYLLCDNHLINNVILSLIPYDGTSDVPEYVWKNIKTVRTAVLKFLTLYHKNSYIFTNVLGDIKRDYTIFNQVQRMAETRGSLFVPVKLVINSTENRHRISNPERLARFKSINPTDIVPAHKLITITHPHALELDVTFLSPTQGMQAILNHINLLSQ